MQPHFVQPAEDAVTRLLSDPALMAAHRAMLPPPRRRGDPFDPVQLLVLAKLDEMSSVADTETLTRAERAAVLADAEGLRRLESLTKAAVRPMHAAYARDQQT